MRIEMELPGPSMEPARILGAARDFSPITLLAKAFCQTLAASRYE